MIWYEIPSSTSSATFQNKSQTALLSPEIIKKPPRILLATIDSSRINKQILYVYHLNYHNTLTRALIQIKKKCMNLLCVCVLYIQFALIFSCPCPFIFLWFPCRCRRLSRRNARDVFVVACSYAFSCGNANARMFKCWPIQSQDKVQRNYQHPKKNSFQSPFNSSLQTLRDEK